ncbi:hypothetical protein D3C75_1110590 [compost metagenome]
MINNPVDQDTRHWKAELGERCIGCFGGVKAFVIEQHAEQSGQQRLQQQIDPNGCRCAQPAMDLPRGSLHARNHEQQGQRQDKAQ